MEPVADLARLRSDAIYPDAARLQLGRSEPHAGESDTTRALRERGLIHDRVSRRMLAGASPTPGGVRIGARTYRCVLLDPLEVAEPALVERIADIAEAETPVLALGALPRRAPGLRDAGARDRRVRAATRRLSARVVRVREPDPLGELLAQHVTGMLVGPPPGESLEVSLEQRRSSAGNVLLVFNESWSPTKARLRFARAGDSLTLWDPRSGSRTKLRGRVEAGEIVSIDLAAAETLILTLRASPPAVRS